MTGFRNNFEALSKQLLVSQAAIGKLEKLTEDKRVTGKICFSQLLSNFIEVSRNFIFDFVRSKKAAKNCEVVSAHTKNSVLIFRTLRNIVIIS